MVEIYDYFDDVPKGLFVKIQKGYGSYEFVMFNKVVNADGTSKTGVERDAVGSILLYDKSERLVCRFRPE